MELRALRAALGTDRDGRSLLVGSVKTNIGHLEPAAGVAGLIKAVLCLVHGEIPRHLHLDTLHREAGTGIVVPPALTVLPRRDQPSVVGVSSFGASGTNAHVILEQACVPVGNEPTVPDRTAHVLALSAKSAAALTKLVARYSERLSTIDDDRLADLCFTANTGRAMFSQRAAFTASSARGMRERLGELGSSDRHGNRSFRGDRPTGPIVFLFSGENAVYTGMGGLLFDTAPRFQETLDRVDGMLRPLLGRALRDVLNRDDLLTQPRYARPALFAVEYALARLWRDWGVEPDVLLGRGIGEHVAACWRGT
ncbi:CurL C-terminal domain-containing protein, partial [Nocardia gipuzkoensis]